MLESCTFEEAMATPSWARFVEKDGTFSRVPPAMWEAFGGSSFFDAANTLWAEILGGHADRPA